MRGLRSGRGAVVVVAAVVAISAAPTVAAAQPLPDAAPVTRATAVPGLAPADSDASAVYLDEKGVEISNAGGTPQSASRRYLFRGSRELSVHPIQRSRQPALLQW